MTTRGELLDLAKPNLSDAAEILWVVLANVSGGDWTQQSPVWQQAAARWRDNYFAAIKPAASDLLERLAQFALQTPEPAPEPPTIQHDCDTWAKEGNACQKCRADINSLIDAASAPVSPVTPEPVGADIKGCCPSCGHTTLFYGSSGYVTCSWLPCKHPCAASDLLQRPAPTVEEAIRDVWACEAEDGGLTKEVLNRLILAVSTASRPSVEPSVAPSAVHQAYLDTIQMFGSTLAVQAAHYMAECLLQARHAQPQPGLPAAPPETK